MLLKTPVFNYFFKEGRGQNKLSIKNKTKKTHIYTNKLFYTIDNKLNCNVLFEIWIKI
jgi:hypothetical protein